MNNKFILINIRAGIWTSANTTGADKVGGAQFHLPIHVLQEYCNPNRPFEPCPNFSTQYTLERKLPDWLSSAISIGKFDFVVFRRYVAVECVHYMRLGLDGSDGSLLAARSALISLYSTRTQQRGELVASLVGELRQGQKANP